MNLKDFFSNPVVNPQLKKSVQMYVDTYTDHLNDASIVKSNYGKIFECVGAASLNPKTTKTAASKSNEIDCRYKNITFECKQGSSAFCTYDYQTGVITSKSSRGMMFCFCLEYSPSKNFEDVAYFIPYYELVEYLHSIGRIRLKQNTNRNKQFRKELGITKNFPKVELAPQFDKLTYEEYENLIKISMTTAEFKEYASNRRGFPYKSKDLINLFQEIIYELRELDK